MRNGLPITYVVIRLYWSTIGRNELYYRLEYSNATLILNPDIPIVS